MADTFSFDEQQVNKIVDTMKKKYKEEGLVIDEVNTSLKELRGLIAEETYSKIDIDNASDVQEIRSSLAKSFASLYLKIKSIAKPTQNFFKNFTISQELGYYLYSANMSYSANQYMAIAVTAGLVVGLFSAIIGLIIGITTKNIVYITTLPIVVGLIGWLVGTILIMMIPKHNAISRGNACSVELPFALRHMSTELRSGIGLYKTLQAVASSNYGVLSEEFSRTITEIEEGVDTGAALKHMALRTQSKPLKTVVNHMLRAMRIGGNLSDAMSDIAKDVSDDLKNKILAFSQNMNFFAVIFIFIGIIIPVAIIILGAIRNSSIARVGQDLFKSVPLTLDVLILIYFVVMPFLFILMNIFVYNAQPKM